jgi:hypothetical protein
MWLPCGKIIPFNFQYSWFGPTYRVVNKFDYDIASIIYINCLEISKLPLDIMYTSIGGLHAYEKSALDSSCI